MKKTIILLIVLLLLGCGGRANLNNPFTQSDSVSPTLIIRNNFWDVRFVRIYCDGTLLQNIRGLNFNTVMERQIQACPSRYIFNINDRWQSRPIIWEQGDIVLLIESNLSLSSVYIVR